MREPGAGPVQQAAIFLDRDGTINEDIGYAAHPDEIAIYPYAAEAIRLLNDAGLKVIVVTNQSGIARGHLDEAMLARIHDHLRRELASQGARLDAFYYCPHHPRIGPAPYQTVCHCRKPQPGMLEQAARDHQIDLAASYVVGDKASDINLAANAGCRGILVKTGYGEMTLRSQPPAAGAGTDAHSQSSPSPYWCTPHRIAADLLAAVRLILEERQGRESGG